MSNKLSNANFIKWFRPLVQALKDLGGSATPKDAIAKVAQNENVDEVTLNEIRGKSCVKKFDNEIAWARNYLVYAGIIDKSVRGIWTLTSEGKKVALSDELATQIFRKQWQLPKDKEEAIEKKYWLYALGEQARLWDEFYDKSIMGIGWDGLEDLSIYSSREEIKDALRHLSGTENTFMNDSLAAWQFVNDINIGDIVFAKRGYSTVLGRGVVKSDYTYNSTRKEYKNIRQVKWTHKAERPHPGQAVQKTLTNITQYTEYVKELEALFDNEVIPPPPSSCKYTKDNFLCEVYMSEHHYETIKNLLIRKKNIILQGAPGVGKTFAAKRLAYSIIEEKDSSRVQMLQFHQSYSYEDFIMGYRPDNNGFKLVRGAFYEFCKKAQDDIERNYFFIIDEINRGNLSKIFGELFILLEHDKRDEKNSIRLLYENEQFFIPSNVHIIGMMNTTDRSLALLDYALRRRFAFFEMIPAFNSDGFIKYQESMANSKFDRLIEEVKALNIAIKDDVSLGAGFRIGHSYFIKGDSDIIDDAWLISVVNYEIIPLLQEYWFDEVSKVEEWAARLQQAIA